MSLNLRLAALLTVIDNQATIDDSTGKLSSAFDIGKGGHYNFNIELTAIASGSTDALDWELRPTLDGTNFTNAVRTGTIANINTAAERVTLEIKDFMFSEAKLFVASAGGTDTWTITAKVQLLKVHDSPQRNLG